MSRYFKPYDRSEDPNYPEDVRHIRLEIESKYGTLTCSNRKLGELWRNFSEEAYSAGFLDPNDKFIKEFSIWLQKSDDEIE